MINTENCLKCGKKGVLDTDFCFDFVDFDDDKYFYDEDEDCVCEIVICDECGTRHIIEYTTFSKTVRLG